MRNEISRRAFPPIICYKYMLVINITTGGSEPPRVTYGSSNTETPQELHGRRWSDGRKGMLALHAVLAGGARGRARAVS